MEKFQSETSVEFQEYAKNFHKKLENQGYANEAYRELLASFGLATVDELGSLQEGKEELSSVDYPDYYGGAYINEAGILVVGLAGSYADYEDVIHKSILSEHCTFRQVPYSYKKLMKIKEEIQEIHLSNSEEETFKNVTGYGISDELNLVNVDLEIFNKEEIQKFKNNVSDSSLIIFQQGDFAVPVNAPGARIQTSTLGFRARIAGMNQTGFVMSGHGAPAVGNPVRLNNSTTGTILGTVRSRIWNGAVDAAFVQAVNNNIITNRIAQNNHILVGRGATVAVGSFVNMAGSTSGIRAGRVDLVNQNLPIGNVPMTNLSVANLIVQGGDSGGPVYILRDGERLIVGNVVARKSSDGTDRLIYGLITPIVARLGITLF